MDFKTNSYRLNFNRTCFLLRAIVISLIIVSLTACGSSSFIKKPSFIKKAPKPETPRVTSTIDLQVTPRELLTARLINPPPDDKTPRITVGKLIEFADRYLSCDCSGSRFVKTWERLQGSYRLTTNSEFVHLLDFVCVNEAAIKNCYLSEIDRGDHVSDLEKRFVPGSQFIQFVYQNGLQCDREGPCPADQPSP